MFSEKQQRPCLVHPCVTALYLFLCGEALTSARVLAPVVVNPSHFRVGTAPVFADGTNTLPGWVLWFWLGGAMEMNRKVVNALAAALEERSHLHLAFGLHGLLAFTR